MNARRLSTPQFTWVDVARAGGELVLHAFAGRRAMCRGAGVALPADWLESKKVGAICLRCSKELRERKTVLCLFSKF